MNIPNAWETYLRENDLTLTEEQRMVADTLIAVIREDEKVSQFFRARRTGVSFVFNHFERFCRTAQL
jgi:hypothetical protein